VEFGRTEHRKDALHCSRKSNFNSFKDQDFIEAVRQTIKPKLQIAQSQNETTSSSIKNEKIEQQIEKTEKLDKISLPSKKTLSK